MNSLLLRVYNDKSGCWPHGTTPLHLNKKHPGFIIVALYYAHAHNCVLDNYYAF